MRNVINGAIITVENFLEGDEPIAAPNQQINTYNEARLTGRCTIALAGPIGIVAREMSQTLGHANPPVIAP
jgi:hypothetical protein